MRQMPLTSEAQALRDEILAIPCTDEPMMDDVPEYFDLDQLEDLHELALSRSRKAAPELRKLAERFPHFPKLLNYQYVAHMLRNERRQAEAVMKKLAAEHPDYLFTRVEIANKALGRKEHERATAALNPTLSIRDLYPKRDLFHISELKNYYLCVARILAQRGDPQLARGVQAALAEIQHDENADRLISHDVMLANFESNQRRIEKDEKRRITVRPNPLSSQPVAIPRCAFYHEEIADLYEFDMDLPESWITGILALPRETLIRDLVALLDDCIDRTPNFMRDAVVEGEEFAVFHALHFLAEIDGHEACPSLLRLLEMHPKAVDFWLGEFDSYIPQIARIIAGDLPACLAWLKLPAIESRGKGMVTEAMEQIAKCDPSRLPEISVGLGEVLALLIDSPPADNILDTGYLANLISTLTELRANEHLPLIRMAYDKDLIELFNVGEYEVVEEDMAKPMNPPYKWIPMLEQYDRYFDESVDDGDDEDDEEDDGIAYLPPARGLAPATYGTSFNDEPTSQPVLYAGRNDPCPCGSGKKYKKCCLS